MIVMEFIPISKQTEEEDFFTHTFKLKKSVEIDLNKLLLDYNNSIQRQFADSPCGIRENKLTNYRLLGILVELGIPEFIRNYKK